MGSRGRLGCVTSRGGSCTTGSAVPPVYWFCSCWFCCCWPATERMACLLCSSPHPASHLPCMSHLPRRFHRVIPTFMCQGGDFTADNGAPAGQQHCACLPAAGPARHALVRINCKQAGSLTSAPASLARSLLQAPAATPSTAPGLPTRTLPCATWARACCPWPTRGPTPTAASSSSVSGAGVCPCMLAAAQQGRLPPVACCAVVISCEAPCACLAELLSTHSLPTARRGANPVAGRQARGVWPGVHAAFCCCLCHDGS